MNLSKYMAKPDKTIEEHNLELINVLDELYELNYIKNEHLYNLSKVACQYHDFGKTNREFQRRVKSAEYVPFDESKEVAHNVLSFFFINPNEFDKKEDYYRVAHAVLNHHNYCNVYQTIESQKKLIQELLQDFTTYPIKMSAKKRLAEIVEDSEAIIIKGLLHKCDYSASAGYQVEFPNNFLKHSLEYLKAQWQSKVPLADWNELQKFCMDNENKNIIAVAQTGMGKTEAGLHWIGDNKGFFILPLRTAINAIYDRVRTDLLNNENLEERVSILHSESLDYYVKHIEDEELNLFEYFNRGKRMSIPLNISTMDQIFDFVFKYQGYELKLTTLAYSKIVIDEIQMYSPDLLAYLICGIESIISLGGRIAILTATLSPFIKDRLIEIIPEDSLAEGVFVTDSVRHNVRVIDSQINSGDILNQYKNNEKEGVSNKFLVVCNTIKRAQQIYEELQEVTLVDEDEVILPLYILHSQFIRKERAEKEKKILEFGQTYDSMGNIDQRSGIWISTQLVEASLDIDFDYLFTELQDLNSLFQRFGRCNRKGVKSIEKYNCTVYLEINKKNLISQRGFIDDTLFEISKKAISKISGPINEKKKIELIQEHLTTENLENSQFLREFRENYEYIKGIPPYKFERDENRLRNILTENIIPSPIYEINKELIHDMVEQLSIKNLNYVAKMKLREKIMQFTVSIPFYQVERCKKEVSRGRAEWYPEVTLGKYERIKILECVYDEMGFRALHYQDTVREANIL